MLVILYSMRVFGYGRGIDRVLKGVGELYSFGRENGERREVFYLWLKVVWENKRGLIR